MFGIQALLVRAAALLLVLPAGLAAAGAAGQRLVFVADSRRYAGWQAWFTNLYNESLAQFTLLTIVLVPLLALALSSVMGFFLSRTGIDLKSRPGGGAH